MADLLLSERNKTTTYYVTPGNIVVTLTIEEAEDLQYAAEDSSIRYRDEYLVEGNKQLMRVANTLSDLAAKLNHGLH